MDLMPAPVDRTSASTWLNKHPWITFQENKPSTSITHVACESKLHSVVRSFMYPCPGKSCILPGLPTHLVQELNAGTAHRFHCMSTTHRHLYQSGTNPTLSQVENTSYRHVPTLCERECPPPPPFRDEQTTHHSYHWL